MRKSLKVWILAALLGAPLSIGFAQEGEQSVQSQAAVAKLSPKALKTLVAGIAFYPDIVIEHILVAAQDPASLNQAAEGRMPAEANPSLKFLGDYPEILKKLDEHSAVTARLGLAAQNQLVELWAAIDELRAELDEANEQGGASASETSTVSGVVAVPVRRPFRAFVAGVIADEAVEELRDLYYDNHTTTTTTTTTTATGGSTQTQSTTIAGNGATQTTTTVEGSEAVTGPLGGTSAVETSGSGTTVTSANGNATAGTGSGSTTVTGPMGNSVTTQSEGSGARFNNGITAVAGGKGTTTVTGPNGNSATATGGGVAGATQKGNTTYFGAAGGGTVTTSNGASVSGAGGVKGSLTVDESGASLQKQSSGAVVNNNTGAYAAGTRSTKADVTYNADGSTSFSRSAATQLQSSNGYTNIDRNTNATVNGDGTGTFQSTTSIDSSRGDATVTTQAGEGQVTTTVTTDNGSKSATLGDGEVQNKPDSSGASERQAKQGEKSSSAKSGSSSKSTSTRSSASNSKRSQGNSRYQQVNVDQMKSATQMMSDSWGELKNRSVNANQKLGQKGNSRTINSNNFSRPNNTSSVNRGGNSNNRSTPSRGGNAGGKGSRGGGRGR